jgi:hypothetical protein
VHQENEHITAKLEHKLVLVLVGEQHRDIVVVFRIVVAVVFFKTLCGILEELHRFQGHSKNALFQFTLGYQ